VKKPGTGNQGHKIVLVHALYVLVFCLLCMTACSPILSAPEQVKRFKQAGRFMPTNSPLQSVKTQDRTGPYRVGCGDLLELQTPTIFLLISSETSPSTQKVEPYLCRVSDSGTITLPIVGQIHVAGKTLAEIELMIVEAYYPKYVVHLPVVVCTVKEYQNQDDLVFTVLGLVKKPAAFPYPPNVQYNLMEALAFAGGFDLVADPRYVKIFRQDTDGEIVFATFKIDNDTLVDAYDVLIKPGDVIYIDHTFQTRVNTFLSDVLTIGVGADVRYRR